jgi:microcystin-dependent protein
MNPTFVGSIYIFAGNFAINGFQLCQGQSLSIAQNEVLYVLIGTTFGGDGQTTFNLPDLRGRVAINQGQGPGLSNYVIGQASGTENVTLNANQMPSHTHLVNASSAAGTVSVPTPSSYVAAPYTGTTAEKFYNTAATNATMSNSVIGNAGNSLPFSIIQPVLAMSYVISMFGIFPSQN